MMKSFLSLNKFKKRTVIYKFSNAIAQNLKPGLLNEIPEYNEGMVKYNKKSYKESTILFSKVSDSLKNANLTQNISYFLVISQ